MYYLRLVSEEVYLLDTHVPELISCNNLKQNAFGIIESNNRPRFKISWQSIMMIPKINYLSDNIIAIGIDQYFAVVDLENQKELFHIILDSFFMKTAVYSHFIYVVCQLSIYKVNRQSLILNSEIGLPDIPKKTIINENELVIVFEDSQMPSLSIVQNS